MAIHTLLATVGKRPIAAAHDSQLTRCPVHCPPEAVRSKLQYAHTDQPDLCEPAVPHGDHQVAFNGKQNLSWILEIHPWVNGF